MNAARNLWRPAIAMMLYLYLEFDNEEMVEIQIIEMGESKAAPSLSSSLVIELLRLRQGKEKMVSGEWVKVNLVMGDMNEETSRCFLVSFLPEDSDSTLWYTLTWELVGFPAKILVR